jgi:hypothetical protein
MPKHLSFTPENVVRSFSEVTGIAPDRLSVDEELGPMEPLANKLCTLLVDGPVVDGLSFEDVSIFRDQKVLDELMAGELPCDISGEFYDVGDLSAEDIVRHASKGCTLSDLKHWIISEGRYERLSDDQIKAQLKRPLETLIEHYRGDDMEGAYTTLVRQCRSDEEVVAKHLLRAAGGAQKVWKEELFETLPGGFVVHFILSEDQQLFHRLKEEAKKGRGR